MSSVSSSQQVRRLPLHEQHAQKGARFGVFGDWEVPLYYSNILEEHHQVRNQAGLFDISHMGEFFVHGPKAVDFLDNLLPRNIRAMKNGQALYMPLLNERATFIDDIIVYRMEVARFLIIVNASNVEKDFAWLKSQAESGVVLEDKTEQMGLLALQGPKSSEILGRILGDSRLTKLPYYHFQEWKNGVIARTGYTGEDGFEIMAPKEDLPEWWDLLFSKASKEELVPAGFGCRDTLRLEAGMLLYGHDMDERINPLEAGIGWTLDWNKASFVGYEILKQEKEKGVKKKLVGFEMIDRGIPRQDYEIKKGDEVVGKVTSGSFSPTLKKNIGLGYVPTAIAQEGQEIQIQIRGQDAKAVVTKLPFYRRKK